VSKPVPEIRYESGVRCGEMFAGLTPSEKAALGAALGDLRELSGAWWVGNMRAMQAAGKPVYVLGRLITSAI